MKLCMIGTGYVGLVSGVCFSDMGNTVYCVDKDKDKVNLLNSGKVPIYEPGLEEILKRNFKQKRLIFTSDLKLAVNNSDIIFICVGTPTKKNSNSADLKYIFQVANQLKKYVKKYKIIITKSTVPVTTGDKIEKILKNLKKRKLIDIVSNPEFLREGRAVFDFYNPDRIVIGGETKKSIEILKNFYSPLIKNKVNVPDEIKVHKDDIPIIETNLPSAQMIKYGSNAFLANKVSFINEIAQICETVGANINDVTYGMGIDPRIGSNYMQPGPGFGGPCLEKDLMALVELGNFYDLESTFMKAILKRNERQVELILDKITSEIKQAGSLITILGLSFKANTDDVRNSASVKLIKLLLKKGYKVNSYDPKAKYSLKNENYLQFDDLYSSLNKSNCVVIMTEWDDFKNLNFIKISKLMSSNIILDMRNIIDKGNKNLSDFKLYSLGS